MRRLVPAAVLVLLALVAFPGPALGHADLISSDPREGDTVEGPFFRIILAFDQPLANGSKAEVLKTGESAVFLTIPPDPDDPTRIAYAPVSTAQQFSAGSYEIRWTSIAEDGDLLRGTITFTVTAPAPTPQPTPTPEPSSTPPPATPTPTPTVAPSPAPTAPPGDGSGDNSAVIFPIVVGLVLVGVAAMWLIRRRPIAP